MTTTFTVQRLNGITGGDQSPPVATVLPDGRVMYVWIDNGLADNTTTMALRGMIYNADGTISQGEFNFNATWAVDGADAFDWDNLSLDTLPDGKVVISYVRNTAETGGDEPVFTIVDPSITPNLPGYFVARNVEVQQFDVTTYESPPVTTVLQDGRILFVWSRNGVDDDTTSMALRARIFNADGTPATSEFSAATWAIDGTDGFDMANLTVTQTTGGNVVIGYVRSWAETGGDEPVFSVLSPNGMLIVGGVEIQQNDVTATESPPAIVALEDGRFIAVWVRNGAADDTLSMTIQGRIFNANGTPSTAEFQIGARAVDGSDFFDTDNLVLERLSDGRVVVGYVDSHAGDGTDYPMFSIIDTSPANGSPWQVVVADRQINDLSTPESAIIGPPVIEPLGDGSRFVAVWVDGDSASANALKYRLYSSDGTPLTPESFLTTAGNTGVTTADGFDWNNVSVLYNATNDTFSVSWVGNTDGSGTGIFTTGPMAAGSVEFGVNIVDGSTGADLIGAGFVDAQGDQIDGTDGNDDYVQAGAGNDTIASGTGADQLYGQAGDDRFVLTDLAGVTGSVTTNQLQYYNVDPIRVNTDAAGNQSPPKMVALPDGRVLYVWTNNALADDTTTLTLQGRIFGADGMPQTAQFPLTGLWAVDGTDGYDWDNLDLDALPDGRVVVSYVRSAAVTGGDEPVFAILNPNIAPSAPGFIVVSNVEVQQNDTTAIESPPITTVLQDGNILFLWTKDALADDSTTMDVQGRIFRPDGTALTSEFQIGTWGVDGTDGYDLDNLTATQLTGGNIVIGYVRSFAEDGDDEPVFSILTASGQPVRTNVEFQQTDTTVLESPPAITALPDGRFMGVWVKNGLADDTPTMTVQGRIFNADGTPSTGEFQIGLQAVDGSDIYDSASLTIHTLGDGKVVVGAVQSWSVAGRDWPQLSIIDPTKAPGAPGFAVISNVQINDFTTNLTLGPPIIRPLGPSGNFVAVWTDGNATTNELYYRVYDSFGKPLTQQTLVTAASVNGVSNLDGFDWDNVQLLVTGPNAFKLAWVSQFDGSGTGAVTSGVINVATTVDTLRDQIFGGEVGETTGDTLDLSAIQTAVSVTYDGSEAGRVTDATTPQNFATFAEIEALRLGAGADTVTGTASAAPLWADGGAGADSLVGGTGSDTLQGGSGNDTISGDIGSDLLTGGDGADLVSGGQGADSLVAGSGNDTLLGGADRDTFANFTAATGAATVVDGGEGGDDWDILDLTGSGPNRVLRDPNAPENGTVEFLDANGNVTGTATFSNIEQIICFCRGTLIRTEHGDQPVESLTPGLRVMTVDGGLQPVRWIGARKISAHELAEHSHLSPVCIRAGALGDGLPRRDVSVSPQHRILVRSRIVARMTGAAETLIAAKHLVGIPGIEHATAPKDIEYWHVLFDRHHLIFAENMASESLHTGRQALQAIDRQALHEILALFPDAMTFAELNARPLARPEVNGRIGRKLVERHLRNDVALFAEQEPA